MSKKKVVDNTLVPLQTLSNLTPDDITSEGAIMIGVYKGNAAFVDLDKQVNQPLVNAEEQYINGILDGREEDYDQQTSALVAAEAVGTSHVEELVVPTTEVWFVQAIVSILPASGGANIVAANWYCSLWNDRVGSLGHGQAFHAADFNFGAGGGTQTDEFGWVSPLWAITNKEQALRLPGGTVLTFVTTNTTAVAAGAVNAVFDVVGYVGKQLVA